MNPQTLMLLAGGGLLAWYFFGSVSSSPTPTTGNQPAGSSGSQPSGNQPSNNSNQTTSVIQTPNTLPLAQRLAAAAGSDSQDADHWNAYYKAVSGSTVDQPAPESYLPEGVDRFATMTATQYLGYRHLSGLGYTPFQPVSGLGVHFDRRMYL